MNHHRSIIYASCIFCGTVTRMTPDNPLPSCRFLCYLRSAVEQGWPEPRTMDLTYESVYTTIVSYLPPEWRYEKRGRGWVEIPEKLT